MCFNSARIHNASDRNMLEALVPYILHGDYELGLSTQLFLQLSYPEEIPRSEMHPVTGVDRPVIYPDVNRIGSLCFLNGVDKIVLRLVCLRSFTFLLAYWPLGRKYAGQMELAGRLMQRRPHTVLLEPGQGNITLVCDGMGAWESFKASQGHDMMFDADE